MKFELAFELQQRRHKKWLKKQRNKKIILIIVFGVVMLSSIAINKHEVKKCIEKGYSQQTCEYELA